MSRPLQVVWRLVNGQDATFLRELHDLNRPEFADLPDRVRLPLLDMQYRAREAGYQAQYPHSVRQLLLFQGQAVGQMLLFEDSSAVTLVDFAVHPTWQRQGIGSAALRLLQAHAGSRPVHLQVATDSPAQRLYIRLGFMPTAQDELNIQMVWQAEPPARPVVEVTLERI